MASVRLSDLRIVRLGYLLRRLGVTFGAPTGFREPYRASAMTAEKSTHVYDGIIEKIFFDHYEEGVREFEFDRDEIADAATTLGVTVPKNVGDVIYTYRHRRALPPRIRSTAPGEHWTIPGAGRSRYRFQRRADAVLTPNTAMLATKIPDATPGVIQMYALTDEQALLARLRYNRLIDIFTGLTCYSLQNHLRTTVPGIGQVETDEIYVGIDGNGAHYIVPVQAKGGADQLGTVQIEQDLGLCAEKYPDLLCRPVGAQFAADDVIALFGLAASEEGVKLVREKHYRLVRAEELSEEELLSYLDAGLRSEQ